MTALGNTPRFSRAHRCLSSRRSLRVFPRAIPDGGKNTHLLKDGRKSRLSYFEVFYRFCVIYDGMSEPQSQFFRKQQINKRSTQGYNPLSGPFNDSGRGDRTHDLTGMNRTLSPAELRRQIKSTEIMIQQRKGCVNRFHLKSVKTLFYHV